MNSEWETKMNKLHWKSVANWCQKVIENKFNGLCQSILFVKNCEFLFEVKRINY